MRTDCFSEEAVKEAYAMAAEKIGVELSDFSEASTFFNFSVTGLGAGLSMDVECDTGLPVSTPAELREKKFQQRLSASQSKANKIADKQRRVAEALAKKMTRKMRKEQKAK
jgi:hypothetical protein